MRITLHDQELKEINVLTRDEYNYCELCGSLVPNRPDLQERHANRIHRLHGPEYAKLFRNLD